MLIVAATDLELDAARGAATLRCGVGPVEAAATTARELARERPTAVLHIGIAGSWTLDPPALVLGTESIYYDLLDPGSSFPRIDRELPDEALLEAARRALPDAHALPIGTAGRIGGTHRSTDVEAMEGFGVLRAAALAGVPAIELRAVSNRVDEPDRRHWCVDDALAALAAAVATLTKAFDA